MRKSLFVFLAPYSLIAMEFPQPASSHVAHGQPNGEQRIVFLEQSMLRFGELLITQQKSLAALTETMVEQSKTHQELTKEIRKIMAPLKRGRKPQAEIEQARKDAQDEVLTKIKKTAHELVEDQKKVLVPLIDSKKSQAAMVEELQKNRVHLEQLKKHIEGLSDQFKNYNEVITQQNKKLHEYQPEKNTVTEKIDTLLQEVRELKKKLDTNLHTVTLDECQPSQFQLQMKDIQNKLEILNNEMRQLSQTNNIFSI